MTKAYKHLGYVNPDRHPATPLVVGDFEVMKDWKGDSDDTPMEIELSKGKVVALELELTAPEVFQATPDEVVLLVEPGNNQSLFESFTLEELQKPLNEPLEEAHDSWEIKVPSGALVIAVAYIATPEEGSDTSGLGNFHEGVPLLPKKAPAKPFYSKDPPDSQCLAIVPVTPGTFKVELGDASDPFMKCVIRRTGD